VLRERQGWGVLASNGGKFRLTPGRAVEFIRQLNFCLNHDGIRPSVEILSTHLMGPPFEPKARQRLVMAASRRLPPSTQDPPRCHTYQLSQAGLKAANHVSIMPGIFFPTSLSLVRDFFVIIASDKSAGRHQDNALP
jgi:hypothetical protein